jgi:hypothetical protein
VKEYREVQRPHQELVRRACDICLAATKDYRNWPDSRGDVGSYGVNEVRIEHRIGSAYPEGTFIKVFEPDICPDCFRRVVLAALRAAGVRIAYTDPESGQATEFLGDDFEKLL